jgi:hypothetical protein
MRRTVIEYYQVHIARGGGVFLSNITSMVINTLSSLYGKYAGTNYLDDILGFVRWLFCGDILFAEVMYRLIRNIKQVDRCDRYNIV